MQTSFSEHFRWLALFQSIKLVSVCIFSGSDGNPEDNDSSFYGTLLTITPENTLLETSRKIPSELQGTWMPLWIRVRDWLEGLCCLGFGFKPIKT